MLLVGAIEGDGAEYLATLEAMLTAWSNHLVLAR